MDFRIDADFFEHPKALHLIESAGSDGLVWLFRLWAYATKYRQDGNLCGLDAARIRSALRVAEQAHQGCACDGCQEWYETVDPVHVLSECGFLVLVGDTYRLHDWDAWQPWVVGAKERSVAAQRAAKAKWDKGNNPDAGRIASAGQAHHHNHKSTLCGSDAPSPSPSPSPSPKEDKNRAADAAIPFREIIQDLNEKTKQGYGPTTKATQDKIRARWNEGWRLNDFLYVNTVKAKEWLGTDMAKFLRPETLYGPKFESYLNQKPPEKPKTKEQIEIENANEISNRAVERTRREMADIYGDRS